MVKHQKNSDKFIGGYNVLQNESQCVFYTQSICTLSFLGVLIYLYLKPNVKADDFKWLTIPLIVKHGLILLEALSMFCQKVYSLSDVIYVIFQAQPFLFLFLWSFNYYTGTLYIPMLLTWIIHIFLCDVSSYVSIGCPSTFWKNMQYFLLALVIDNTWNTNNVIWPVLPTYIGLAFLTLLFVVLNLLCFGIDFFIGIGVFLVVTGPLILLLIYPFFLGGYLANKF